MQESSEDRSEPTPDDGAVVIGWPRATTFGLSAGDLLESSALMPALAHLQCSRCLYLSAERTLFDRRRRCPHCKQSGVRAPYPDAAAAARQDMVRYFYASALQDQAQRRRQFGRDFRRAFPSDLKDAEIVALAEQAQRAGPPADADLARVRERLRLEDADAVEGAYARLLVFSDAAYEFSAVVILGCAVLDGLLRQVLSMKLAAGVRRREPRTPLDQLEGFDRLERTFKELTGRALAEELAHCADERFYEDWKRLNARRTAFLRGDGPRFSEAEARTVFLLTLESSFAFACIHNNVTVGTKQYRHGRGRGLAEEREATGVS